MSQGIVLKDVYAITERENGIRAGAEAKSQWTKVGIGFVNRDSSINVVLDAIPVNGRLHIRDRQNRKSNNQQQGDHP